MTISYEYTNAKEKDINHDVTVEEYNYKIKSFIITILDFPK